MTLDIRAEKEYRVQIMVALRGERPNGHDGVMRSASETIYATEEPDKEALRKILSACLDGVREMSKTVTP